MKRLARPGPALALLLLLWIAGQAPATAGEAENPHGAFVEDCSLCHSSEGWKPAIISDAFVHAKRRFPLTLSHGALTCLACHKSLEFRKAASACIDCHQDIHRGEFGLDCSRCHTTRNFIERASGVRTHRMTRFPLLGSHASVDCSRCHRAASPGQATYVNTPTACEACHLPAYNATTNPDHRASGFSTDCSTCHGSTAWSQARFNHDAAFFPIYRGAHAGRWSSCSTCHINPANYADFSCFGCHPHSDKARTDSDHQGEPGYSYDSQACYTCHPQGRH